MRQWTIFSKLALTILLLASPRIRLSSLSLVPVRYRISIRMGPANASTEVLELDEIQIVVGELDLELAG